ncbi:MAG: hypothetical protein JWN93_3165 [Hyphomicrobiales bacterium]|nr:hypothetical protein [Hyphomicrobiales bacterium]
MILKIASWRPLALGLAVAGLFAAPLAAQTMPLADRVAVCAGCHGEGGNSAMENIPSLAGQPDFFVMNQLILMREGVRPVEAMSSFVKELKDDEIVALADHFSKLKPVRSDEKIDPALVARGAALATRLRCASCHLPALTGQQQMPRLAGQRVDYMLYAMKAFRDNARAGADTQMTAVIFGASDADLEALAHYAASK